MEIIILKDTSSINKASTRIRAKIESWWVKKSFYVQNKTYIRMNIEYKKEYKKNLKET